MSSCRVQNEASIKAMPHVYSSGEDASEWQVFAEFEARGMQPVEWVMMPGFALVGPSGFKFEDDSLEDAPGDPENPDPIDWNEVSDAATCCCSRSTRSPTCPKQHGAD